jgi:hypothetical protein
MPRGGVEVQLYSFNLGARWGWVVNAMPWPLYPQERDPVPIVQEAGWAPGQVWMGEEYLAPTSIQSPDHPVCSKLLYQLRYPGPLIFVIGLTIISCTAKVTQDAHS